MRRSIAVVRVFASYHRIIAQYPTAVKVKPSSVRLLPSRQHVNPERREGSHPVSQSPFATLRACPEPFGADALRGSRSEGVTTCEGQCACQGTLHQPCPHRASTSPAEEHRSCLHSDRSVRVLCSRLGTARLCAYNTPMTHRWTVDRPAWMRASDPGMAHNRR